MGNCIYNIFRRIRPRNPRRPNEADPESTRSASDSQSHGQTQGITLKARRNIKARRDINLTNNKKKVFAVGSSVFFIGFGIAIALFFIPPVGRSACEMYLVSDEADLYCQNPGIAASSHSVKTILGSVRSDANFIGREKELAEITKRFQDSNYVILDGPHGVGTTSLALQYAHINKFSSVIGIDARTTGGIEKPFRTAAKMLRTNSSDENVPLLPDGIKEVHDLLECHPTLLIFDGVEEFYRSSKDSIHDYYPYSSIHSAAAKHQIKTIVTTHGWHHFPDVLPPFRKEDIIRIDTFNLDDCKHFVLMELSSAVTDRDTNWAKLAEYYNCLPLSLKIATQYISDKAKIGNYNIEIFLHEATHSKTDLKSANRRYISGEDKISSLVQNSVNLTIESAGGKAEYIIHLMAFAPPEGIAEKTLIKIAQLIPELKMSEENFRETVDIIVQHRVLYSKNGEDHQMCLSMDRLYHEEIIRTYNLEFITKTFFNVFQSTDDKDVSKAVEGSLVYLEAMIKQNLEDEDLVKQLCQNISNPLMERFRSCKILRTLYQNLAYPFGKYFNTTQDSRRASKLLVKCYENSRRKIEALNHLKDEYDVLKNSRDLSSTLTEYEDEIRIELAEMHRQLLEPFQGYQVLESHYYDCRKRLDLGHSESLRAAKDLIEYLLKVGLERRKQSDANLTPSFVSLISQLPANVEISVKSLATHLQYYYHDLSTHLGPMDHRAVEILSIFLPPLVFNQIGFKEAKDLYSMVVATEGLSLNFKIETLRNFISTLILAGHNHEAIRMLRDSIDSMKNQLAILNGTFAYMDRALFREEAVCLLQNTMLRTHQDHDAYEHIKLALYRQLELAGVPLKQRTADFVRTTKLCKNFKATGVTLKSLIAESNQAKRGLPGMFTIVGAAVGLIWQLSL